jgi:hypothetical protein
MHQRNSIIHLTIVDISGTRLMATQRLFDDLHQNLRYEKRRCNYYLPPYERTFEVVRLIIMKNAGELLELRWYTALHNYSL